MRVSTSDGRVVVAKWFARADEGEKHHRTLKSIAASNIPAPSPIGFTELSPGKGSVVLMEHLTGVVWYACAGDAELDRVRTDAAAAVLRNLESLESEKLKWRRMPFDQLRKEPLADAEEYRRRMREVSVPPVARDANEVLASLPVAEPWDTVPDHGDFGPHNLLCDHGRITGLVDWDRVAIRDCAKTIGTAVAELLGMTIPIQRRSSLVRRFTALYAEAHGCSEAECRIRALPYALTRTLDWLLYGKAAPAAVHEESLKELTSWRK